MLVISVSLLAGCFDSNSNNNSKNSGDGEYGEDFEITLLDGSKKNISEFKGNIVLLDFFGVNCQPCQLQMMVLDQISENYQNKGVEIISIDVWISIGETPGLVEQFIDAYKEQLDIILDWTFAVDDTAGTLFNRYIPVGGGVPMIYILDKNGNIYYSNSGYTEYSVLAGKLDELII